jgi:hypothetical protein
MGGDNIGFGVVRARNIRGWTTCLLGFGVIQSMGLAGNNLKKASKLPSHFCFPVSAAWISHQQTT